MDARRLVVDGLGVRVLESAPQREADDPVLLIHGLGGWAENWRGVMPAVAASGRRAVAVDLPGFGESERPRRARHFDPDDPLYAKFIVAALDALGVERAHIAGHSLGGAIAYTVAVSWPERVRSLTLVAPGGLTRELIRELRVLTLPGMELLTRWRRSPRLVREVLYSCFYDPAKCPEQLVGEAVRYGGPAVGEMIRALRSAVTFFGGVRDDVRLPWISRAERYRGPALVVWGREDAIIPSSAVSEVRRIAPQAQVRVLSTCGHLLMVECLEPFLETFLPFLETSGKMVSR